MSKQQNVQIPFELFLDLVKIHCLDMADEELQTKVSQGLQAKLDAIVMRETYSKYKTADTAEEREKARQEYLDKRGIHKNFRW